VEPFTWYVESEVNNINMNNNPKLISNQHSIKFIIFNYCWCTKFARCL